MMTLAWTTVSKREDADCLAAASVSAGLAACAQVDGPIASYYRWEGRTEHQQEFRLTFKTLPIASPHSKSHVLDNHPYETPEWIVCAGHPGLRKILVMGPHERSLLTFHSHNPLL